MGKVPSYIRLHKSGADHHPSRHAKIQSPFFPFFKWNLHSLSPCLLQGHLIGNLGRGYNWNTVSLNRNILTETQLMYATLKQLGSNLHMKGKMEELAHQQKASKGLASYILSPLMQNLFSNQQGGKCSRLLPFQWPQGLQIVVSQKPRFWFHN